jgi:diguanylate cyclase (GGDEF)-like protein
MNDSPQSRFLWEPIAVLLATSIFVGHTLMAYPAVVRVDNVSLFFESLVALLPATGMFLVRNLRAYKLSVYRPVLTGLATLTFSMATDVMDELVDMPETYNMVFEGFFEIAGFAFLVLGLRRWIVYNETLKAQLLDLATTDFLTGAFNRRHFGTALQSELERAGRQPNPFSVIFFDVDRFKQVNDSFGHEAGDRVLVGVAQLIQKQLRKTDVFARYGGEEFAILLPQTKREGALALAEKCRLALQENSFAEVGSVSASFGVATFEGNETSNQFLKRVDQALYQAKASGRNRVVAAN